MEKPHETPVLDTPPTPIPPIDDAGPNNVSVAKSHAKKYACPAQDEVSTGPTPVGDDLDRKDAPTPLRASSWE